jgi:prepilin-type N-terminal cleavage/methylation domain-containing protein
MSMKCLRRMLPRGQRGFTVIEVLVAATVGLIALAAFACFSRFQTFALRNQAVQLDVQTEARAVIDLMAREVRRAGLDPTCGKAFEGLAVADRLGVEVQADLDGDGAIGARGESVYYRHNPTTGAVERITGDVVDVMLPGDKVEGGSVRYFDGAGNEIAGAASNGGLTATQRAAVRRLRISLALAADPVDPNSSAPARASISTDVELRNRFFLMGTACP